ncbi:MAG: hypothetical protein ACYDDA_13730 [Acidiferrobacteraceae bacterium]
MSTKPNGLGAKLCDVCGRLYTWGCGHSGSQESDSRRHYATAKHKARECMCYGHDHCDPKTCPLAGKRTPCYVPFYQHTPEPEKNWRVVWVSDDKQTGGVLCPGPFTHDEACEALSRFTVRPERRILVEPIR